MYAFIGLTASITTHDVIALRKHFGLRRKTQYNQYHHHQCFTSDGSEKKRQSGTKIHRTDEGPVPSPANNTLKNDEWTRVSLAGCLSVPNAQTLRKHTHSRHKAGCFAPETTRKKNAHVYITMYSSPSHQGTQRRHGLMPPSRRPRRPNKLLPR